VLRGPSAKVQHLGDELLATRGVLHGEITFTSGEGVLTAGGEGAAVRARSLSEGQAATLAYATGSDGRSCLPLQFSVRFQRAAARRRSDSSNFSNPANDSDCAPSDRRGPVGVDLQQQPVGPAASAASAIAGT